MQPFVTKGSIKESWTLFKRHWGVLWGAMLIMLIVSMFMGELGQKLTGLEAFLTAILSMLVSTYLRFGFMRLTLNVVSEKEAHLRQLFEEHAQFIRFIGASILYGIIVGIGFLLFIIPGIIWSIKYGYYGYLILDKNLGVLDSLKKSGEITHGAKWQLLGIGMLMALLVLVSMIPLGLGLLATIPMAAVLTPLLYVKLMRRNAGDVPSQNIQQLTVESTPTETNVVVPTPPTAEQQ